MLRSISIASRLGRSVQCFLSFLPFADELKEGMIVSPRLSLDLLIFLESFEKTFKL